MPSSLIQATIRPCAGAGRSATLRPWEATGARRETAQLVIPGIDEGVALKEQYHPVRDDEECERMIRDTYQGVLAMSVDGTPYAVPLNHAYREGRFYFHCADSGRKLDAIRQNPDVVYVIKKYYGDSAEMAKAMKCHGHWESVIAYGKARVVTEKEELIRTFRVFMAYYGHEDYQHGEELLTKTNVIVIDVERMTARREYDESRTDYWTWEQDS